jgi:hypothetical protein
VPSDARLREGNVASAVVHRAVEKAVAAHNRAYRRQLDAAVLKVRFVMVVDHTAAGSGGLP